MHSESWNKTKLQSLAYGIYEALSAAILQKSNFKWGKILFSIKIVWGNCNADDKKDLCL